MMDAASGIFFDKMELNVRSWRDLCLGLGFALLCGLVMASGARAEEKEIRVPRGGVIAAEGDSLTYGMDISPAGKPTQINHAPFTRSANPYPETLAADLGGCAQVVNRGFPGDRSVDGLVRWQNVPAVNVALLMYGSNDATNYGHSATGVVSADIFHSVLRLIAMRRMAQGATVVLLLPPPIENPRAEAMIAPYRHEVQALGKEMGLPVFDPRQALNGIDPIFTEDKVHLSPAANIAIAKSLASRIRCN
jgi:lysophospholipase L1-like esterase